MIVIGSVIIHAIPIDLTVSICKFFIHHVAAIVQATHDESTCVVLTGNPKKEEKTIVKAVTISATAHSPYVIGCFPILVPNVSTIFFRPTIVQSPSTHPTVPTTQNGTFEKEYIVGKNTMRIAIRIQTPFCQSFDPCAKLTAVQVLISVALIFHGGVSLVAV